VSRGPSHAGRLPHWERLAFALVFTLMAAFVADVTISAVRQYPANPALPGRPGSAGGPVPAVLRPPVRTPAGLLGGGGGGGGSADVSGPVLQDSPDQELRTALAPVLARGQGQLAVGIVDLTTGVRALYAGDRSYPAAGIAAADILAAVLLRHQGSARPLSRSDRELARQMIEDGSRTATARMWQAAGAGGGLGEANARLRLAHTDLGGSPYRDLSRTTAADQLRLLGDFTAAASPLSARSRSFALSLLLHVAPGQAWGVAEAAAPGTRSAVKAGQQADGSGRPQLWLTDSIGVVQRDGQVLLIAVLGTAQPSPTAGMDTDEAAAVAAAAMIVRSAPSRQFAG